MDFLSPDVEYILIVRQRAQQSTYDTMTNYIMPFCRILRPLRAPMQSPETVACWKLVGWGLAPQRPRPPLN
jgi:hypothetical protein